MARYDYTCPDHGTFEIIQKMGEAGGPRPCPVCGVASRRVYQAVPDVWNCDGAFKTDHVKGDLRPGTKRDRLNETWEQAGWGKPPEPAKHIPKSEQMTPIDTSKRKLS